MAILLPEHIRLADRRENLAPSKAKEVSDRDHRTPEILSHELACRLAEDDINLLQGLVLGLRHEEDLVEPSDHGDAAVESKSKTHSRHGLLHLREEVGDEERTEKEGDVAGFHSIGPEVSGVYFRGNDPCETGVASEETFVDDETGNVGSLGAGFVGQWNQV